MGRQPLELRAAPYPERVPPEWLLWLLPVPLATLAAVAWASWAGRARGPVETAESVQAYERFRQAMTTPVPVPRTESRLAWRSRDRSGS